MDEKKLLDKMTPEQQIEVEKLGEDIKKSLPSSWYHDKYADSECYFIASHLYEIGYRKQNDLRLYEMQMKNGEIDMTFGSENCSAFLYSILQAFKQNDGKNFVSTTLEVDGKELGGRYASTIQKVGGLTPTEKARKETAKEIFGELIKSTTLCESQGGHCSLDYLIVKARQHGLEYAGLDKDGNVIWVCDTIKLN